MSFCMSRHHALLDKTQVCRRTTYCPFGLTREVERGEHSATILACSAVVFVRRIKAQTRKRSLEAWPNANPPILNFRCLSSSPLAPPKLANLPLHTAHAQNIPPTPTPPKSRQILRPRNFEPSPNELRPGFLSTIHESPSRWVRNPPASSKPLCASGRDSETRLSLRYGIFAPGREFVVVAVPWEPFSRERWAGASFETMHRWSTRQFEHTRIQRLTGVLVE